MFLAVSMNVSPFDRLLPEEEKSTVSAPSRRAASEKLVRVRVEFSKNKFATSCRESTESLLAAVVGLRGETSRPCRESSRSPRAKASPGRAGSSASRSRESRLSPSRRCDRPDAPCREKGRKWPHSTAGGANTAAPPRFNWTLGCAAPNSSNPLRRLNTGRSDLAPFRPGFSTPPSSQTNLRHPPGRPQRSQKI